MAGWLHALVSKSRGIVIFLPLSRAKQNKISQSDKATFFFPSSLHPSFFLPREQGNSSRVHKNKFLLLSPAQSLNRSNLQLGLISRFLTQTTSLSFLCRHPTEHFAILQPQNKSVGEFYLVKKRQ